MTKKGIEVAPHAGAWIETTMGVGSKLNAFVAPHAGAWIETEMQQLGTPADPRRAPRGRVD